MSQRTVAIYLFEGFEPLDAVGPFEAFICGRDSSHTYAFDVGMVGKTGEPVTGTGGLMVQPCWSFETMPRPDILLVPGGEGTETEVTRDDTLAWIRTMNESCEFMLSVCTGSEILAAAGLLKGLKATTYWNSYDTLRSIEPDLDLLAGARWADNGRIICSAGVSAGIDMALHVIGRIHGEQEADRAAHTMEYEHWPLKNR